MPVTKTPYVEPDPAERVEVTDAQDLAEWSRRSSASLESNGQHIRLILTAERGGLLDLSDVRMTSGAPTARMMRDGRNTGVGITQDEAEWLLRVLPEALAYANQDDGAEPPSLHLDVRAFARAVQQGRRPTERHWLLAAAEAFSTGRPLPKEASPEVVVLGEHAFVGNRVRCEACSFRRPHDLHTDRDTEDEDDGN